VNSSEALDALIDHLRTHAVTTEGGPFRLRSGQMSSWYIDARQTTFAGDGAPLVGAAVLERIPADAGAVGGMTMGADPIALATAIAAHAGRRLLHAFSIRKETKDHGLGGRLVGPVGAGTRAVVLEDTTTTGGALIEAVEVARHEGIEIVSAISLVDRSGGIVAGRLAEMGISYTPLVTPGLLGVE
jgi:orotate phosphoribosyltransferase